VNEANVMLAGDANGPANANQVNAIHETSGPTKLTIGPINDFQLLQRVGTTVVGTAYPPTTLAGDVNGPMTSNQVNAIHETSGPTQLTIGAIGAGQFLLRSGTNVVGANVVQTNAGNPYVDPPLVAGTLDDEFDSGSPDLVARGWTIQTTTGTILTRAGNVEPFTVLPTVLTTTTYLSTIVGSQLLLQLYPGTNCYISKPYTMTSGNGGLVWARVGTPAYTLGSTTATSFIGVNLWYATAGRPDSNNRQVAQTESNGTSVVNAVDTGSVVGGTASVVTKSTNLGSLDLLGIKLRSGTTDWVCFAADSSNGHTESAVVGGVTATTVAFAGFQLNEAAGTGLPNNTNARIYSIDFFRSASGGNAWIGQPTKPLLTGVGNAAGGDLSQTYPNPWVSAVHETSGPSQLTIGAISNGQVLQRSGTSLVGVSAGLPSGNPYVDPPLVAGPYDDEFDSGSPDLAVRGYIVRNASNVDMSRVGDVLPWDNVGAAGLTAATYRSTIVGSQIFVQTLAGNTMGFYKPVTVVAGSGALFWGRMGAPMYYTGASTGTSFLGIEVTYSAGGNPDGNNRIFSQMDSLGTSGNWTIELGSFSGGVLTNNQRPSNNAGPDILGLKLNGGTGDWRMFIADSRAGTTQSANVTALTASSLAFLRVYMAQAAGTGFPNNVHAQVFSIDFIRSASGPSAWIGQAPKVSVTGTYAGLPTGNPYVDPPAVANNFDDEFETGSPDLATRGWTIKNTAGTTLTRSGDVDAWNASGPAAGTYWSTLRGSQLLVQFPTAASTYSIFKAITTLSLGDIYWMRAGAATRLDASTPAGFFEMGLYANASGQPDQNNRVYVSSYGSTTGAWYVDMNRTTAGTTAGTSRQPLGAAIPDMRGIQVSGATTYHPFMTNSGNGDTLSTEPAGAVNISTIAYAGLQWAPPTAYTGTIPYVISLDFFRKTTLGGGIASTPRPVLWNVVNGNIGAYTAKPTPVAADQIYIANSAANDAIYRSTARQVAVAGGTMYEAYPTTTDSWSDEFDGGSSDPTVRGWTVIQLAPTISAMTRLGDVDPTIVPPTAMAAGQYRSTVRNGKLYVQVGGNSGNILYIYKATTGTFVYASGAGCSAFGSSTLRGIYITDNVSVPFGNAAQNSVVVSQDNTGTGNAYKQTGATQTSYASQTLGEPYRSLTFFADWKGSGNLVDCIIMGLDNEALFLYTVNNTAPTAWAPGFAGALVRNTPQFTLSRNWIVIDYIRRYPSGTFFPV
jgi:hypothetical protein